MDKLQKKYDDLYRFGIQLGEKVAARNNLPAEIPYSRNLIPCEFQCYQYGTILQASPDPVWMNNMIFKEYLRLLSEGKNLGLPLKDTFFCVEKELNEDRFYYCLFRDCIIYSHGVNEVCLLWDTLNGLREYITKGLLPES
ncbi:MAG: hypothetical protein Q4B85_13425, partial [Lachnospiraceae bacterium]|nr:hypothetical protein [Lachnospiraceae bacterium]